MSNTTSEKINQLFSEFNEDVGRVFQKETLQLQQTINDLKMENSRKANIIEELEKRVQQVITTKDLIISSLETKLDSENKADDITKDELIRDLQCKVCNQAARIEDLKEENQRLKEELKQNNSSKLKYEEIQALKSIITKLA